MEVVMRRTERGFRGKCDGYNIWLSDKAKTSPNVHILHGEFMITGAIMSKVNASRIHALIVLAVNPEDVIYEHTGFLSSKNGVTARTCEGQFLSPGKLKDLVYEAPMPPPLGQKSLPLPPVVNGKVYARMHDGRLRVVGLPEVRNVREVVMGGHQYQSYLRALESFNKRNIKGK